VNLSATGGLNFLESDVSPVAGEIGVGATAIPGTASIDTMRFLIFDLTVEDGKQVSDAVVLFI
jgi:hypothetical protein